MRFDELKFVLIWSFMCTGILFIVLLVFSNGLTDDIMTLNYLTFLYVVFGMNILFNWYLVKNR